MTSNTTGAISGTGTAYPSEAQKFIRGFIEAPDHFVQLQVFTCLISCCAVRYDFRVKTMFGLSRLPFVWLVVHVLFMLFVFIYAYWCP